MLRVGSVPYVVARPLDLALENQPGLQLVRDVPARLIESLRAGSLDVALVSSIELFRQPGYGYLDGLAVAGRGYVSSVQVFLRRPLEEVRTVALDPASRTSAALTRTVWPPELTPPRFLEVGRDEDPAAAKADAWLCIGDPALREYLTNGRPPTFNPSHAWTQRTGLPFVFAVWITRPGVDLTPWLEVFQSARDEGRRRLEEIVRDAADTLGLPADAMRDYLAEECLYDPGEGMRDALFAWRDAAATLGLCDGALSPRAIGLTTPT